MRPVASIAALVVLIATLTGCNTAMSAQSSVSASPSSKPSVNVAPRTVNGNLLPLRFKRHKFEAKCYNTQRCFVVYDNNGFLHNYKNAPSPSPSGADYRQKWGLASYLGVANFPGPARVTWTSMDGSDLEADVDIGNIFRDELALHDVPDGELAEGIFKQGLITPPSIYLEINDRTLSVFFMGFIPTKSEQIPGNKHSNARSDLYLAWTKTY